MTVDLDRGVTKRIDPETQVGVCMYKDEPGVYYDTNGVEVGKSAAKRAGFNVDEMEKKRLHQLRIKEQMKKINEEFGQGAGRVIFEKSGIRVESVSDTHYAIYDENGKMLTERPLNEKDAVKLAEVLVKDIEKK